MSILIKNLDMPKSCADCPIGDELCCSLMPGVPALWKEYDIAVRTNRRHSHCPLVSVPPHGRLIDADAIIQDKGIDTYSAVFAIASAPTVIEAEEVYNKYTDTAGNLHWTGTRSGEHTIRAEGET